MRKALLALAIATALSLFVTASPTLANNHDRGLQVEPLRHFIQLAAGSSQDEFISVANLTDSPMDVALSVQSFSLANYSYDYRFEEAKYDWIKLETPTIRLEPGQSRRANFTVAIPAGTAAGGQYFTIFASTSLSGGSVTSQVQAASVLFVTVSGELVQTAELQKAEVSPITFTGSVPYTLDVRSTGNVHFFVYTTSHISGPFVSKNSRGPAHLLMPDTNRQVTGEARTPWWPGLYKLTYGYITDAGNTANKTSYVLHLPGWLLLVPIGLIVWRGITRLGRRANK